MRWQCPRCTRMCAGTCCQCGELLPPDLEEIRMKQVEIKVGQVWKDKDRRREKNGTVRTFIVTELSDQWDAFVSARSGDRYYRLRRKRFGSGHANDSFVLVKN